MENLKLYRTIHLKRKDNSEFDSISIYFDSDNKPYLTIYPDGKVIDMGQLERDYEDSDSIKDLVEDYIKEQNEKEKDTDEKEREPDLDDRQNSIDELDKIKKRENEEDKELEGVNKNDINKQQQEKNRSIGEVHGQISLDMMFQGETLRKILGLSEKDVTIAPVSRSRLIELDPEGNYNNKEGFVVIDSKGKQRPLKDDILEPDLQEGNNSFDKDLNIDEKGNVEIESNLASYKVKNRPNVYLSISFDEGTGVRESKISYRSGREGDDEVEFSLLKQEQDDNSDRNKYSDEQRRINDGRGKSEEINARQKEHEKNDCENDRVEDIDDYANNDTHAHITDEQLEKLAEETGENEDKLRERFKREAEKNPDMNPKQLIELIKKDYERLPNRDNR